MDLYKAIRQLYEERERLDRVIASLEELQKAPTVDAAGSPEPAVKRRGRKTMSAEERREVSERMRQYWANRRKKANAKQPGESV
ncbi:MAG TPA: hypothetical protein VN442_08110 [Bryobacteraceae bacterium]|nr:hypothetical protein [Bryobacteraceae bacterium]